MNRTIGLFTPLLLAAAAPVEAQPARVNAQTGAARQAEWAVQPEEQDDLQWAAAVVKTTELRNQGQLGAVKLFGVAGSDPAVNGLNVYVGFFLSPAEGFRIFRIGDFLDYRLVAQRAGQVTLAIQENTVSRSTTIGVRSRRLTITWAVRGDTVPARVIVRDAR
jgi:hypothetical protein